MISDVDSDLLEQEGFRKPTVAVDFDGVLHTYTDPPPGAEPVLLETDAPIDGAIDWLLDVARYFYIVVFSTFADIEERQVDIATWLATHGFTGIPYSISNVKVAAVAYVDDRGWRFDGPGTFPTVEQLLEFRPWWKLAPDLPPLDGDSAGSLAAAVRAQAERMEKVATPIVYAAASRAGGQLIGTEFRLKSEAATEAKIAAVAQEKDLALGQAAADVKDGLRYTATFDAAAYTASVRDALAHLERVGFEVVRLRNYWSVDRDPSMRGAPGTYLGLNAVVASPGGYRFELQLHTPESYLVNRNTNRDLYMQTRDPAMPDAEREALYEQMRTNLEDVEIPDGAAAFRWPDSLTAAGRTRERPKPVSAAAHSRVLEAATSRAYDLEDRLTNLLTPILIRSARTAAAGFRRYATDHLTAAAFREADRQALQRLRMTGLSSGLFGYRLRPEVMTAAAPSPMAAMLCVKPRPEEAAAIADPDGEPPEYLHITLVFLGDLEDSDIPTVRAAVADVAASHAPLSGVVGGYGRFEPAGVGILLPNVPGLVELRVAVTEALVDADLDYGRQHGFEAHITIDSEPEPDEADEMLQLAGSPLHFDALLLVRGDEIVAEMPLVGRPPLTAAGSVEPVAGLRKRVADAQDNLRTALGTGDEDAITSAKAVVKRAQAELRAAVEAPQWTSPAAAEVLDVDALVETLRTKTNPVRQALIKTTMAPALAEAGLSFDVTNPLTAKALADTGEHITGIADTTRANVMKVISASLDQGLSIPDTAKAIQVAMTAAAPIRARMIARTELVGAINGGSLTATQLVSSATGTPYMKQWRTAPGAPHPRHELYEGLDGQTVAMDESFDVGGDSLQYPGDPDGAPEEVINCRCVAEGTGVSGVMLAASRRSFEGQLVRLTTAGGHVLAVTSNHPVLTRRGWIAAGLLNEGDDLICRVSVEQASGTPNVDHMPAEAEKVFAALEFAAARRERVGAGLVNFHGDVAEREVEVVVADLPLALENDAAFRDQLRQLALALSHREVSFDDSASALDGIAEAEAIRLSRASNAYAAKAKDLFDGRSREGVALAESQHALPALVSLADVPGHFGVALKERSMLGGTQRSPYTSAPNVRPNGHGGEAALVADLLVGAPGLVHADPLIDLCWIDYTGYVFNFSSISGVYAAEGILTANCTMTYTEASPTGAAIRQSLDAPTMWGEDDPRLALL